MARRRDRGPVETWVSRAAWATTTAVAVTVAFGGVDAIRSGAAGWFGLSAAAAVAALAVGLAWWRSPRAGREHQLDLNDPQFRAQLAGLPRGHVLYRFYDATDDPVYIGRTVNPRSRFTAHANSWWWEQAAWVHITYYGSHHQLVVAEREAIETETPLANRTHNRSRLRVRR